MGRGPSPVLAEVIEPNHAILVGVPDAHLGKRLARQSLTQRRASRDHTPTSEPKRDIANMRASNGKDAAAARESLAARGRAA